MAKTTEKTTDGEEATDGKAALVKSGSVHVASGLRLGLVIGVTYLLSTLDPPVLVRTMGSKSSPSVPVCGHSLDAVPIDSSVHKVFFKCGPPCLCWPTSFPATSTRSP